MTSVTTFGARPGPAECRDQCQFSTAVRQRAPRKTPPGTAPARCAPASARPRRSATSMVARCPASASRVLLSLWSRLPTRQARGPGGGRSPGATMPNATGGCQAGRHGQGTCKRPLPLPCLDRRGRSPAVKARAELGNDASCDRNNARSW